MVLDFYMKKNNLLIVLVVALAFIFRFWNLSNLPKSLSMDEITYGYSTYSILKTGMDEHGNFLPLSFRGIGDYKPPVDVYLKVPFVSIFGLNEFSIRLLDALLGSISVYVLFLILRKLKISFYPSLLSSLWLALSGSHIFFSRSGYAAITALFFLLLGLYSFIVWILDKKYKYFLLFLASFSLSFWSYHSERILIPLLFLGLVVIFYKNFKDLLLSKKKLLQSVIILMLFVIPFVYELFITKGVLPRASDLWFTKDIQDGTFFNFIKNWLGQYLQYFDLKFIFYKFLELTPKGYPDISLLNVFDAIILIFGFYFLTKTKSKLIKSIFYLIIFLGPIPSAFARGGANPTRTIIWIPALGLLMGLGFEYLVKFVRWSKLIIWGWIIGSILYFIYFAYIFINDFDKYYADLWHFGYKEASLYICENYQKYDKVVLTNRYGIEIPRITTIPEYYILFYCKYDPEKYIKDPQLFNLEIRQPQWRIDSQNKNYLLIGSNWDFPENFDQSKIIKKIYFPNGKEALYFVETK